MLSAHEVTVQFGDRIALEDVSVTVPGASSVALVGGNGSGKTTLLNVIAGLLEPTSGRIDCDANTVAYVLQTRHQHRWLPLTVGEVVGIGRYRSLGLVARFRGHDREAVRTALERMQITDLTAQPFATLSGGQRQRTMVAQALAQEPDLLLLDEPITGLDLPSQELILDLIADEVGAGRTVVISTHNLDEARHCDQVFLLANRLVAAGPPDAVLTASRLRATFGVETLGDHRGHDHDDELLIVDDHGH